MGGKDYLILLEYPVKPAHRYGYGKPAHPQISAILEKARPSLVKRLSGFAQLKEWLDRIPRQAPAEAHEPYWGQGWFGGLDAVALYGMLCEFRPKKFIEVGSGNSTKFARRAIRDHSLPTKIISIDPRPRAEVDRLCDSITRAPMEEVDLTVFDQLQPGDFLFIDSSHRTLPNSDVTVAFLDVIPRLQRGVIVHVHDIFWPYDYPPAWASRSYSEQYLLGAYLLGDGGAKIEILMPNAFVAGDSALVQVCAPLLEMPGIQWSQNPDAWPNGISGGSFWLRV